MKKRLWGILFRLIVLCFIFYVTYVMTVQQPIMQAKTKQLNEMKTLLEEAQQKNLDLREQLLLVESDAYVEKVARERLGLIMPGEKIFIELKD
ncbi:MAG: septum formation initiator family protein [Clostridiaceae bacterium]|jgi:cell division protein FtsB|nr:septum formation initiator family protein [Clostridiaceae bacterium]